ncbi:MULTISPECIES: hypothetical protein [Protofrankia]|uniref:Uncharacterized protein n=2 Tax=Protofrankia TaxID=2994361 RepID=F8AYS4_9ACTN|nr:MULTISPECIES: hypothetical protein [Protofrankia]AEH08581.1 hypothetical protein FsymDg_1079 [Candidatus Protofrankia datiscae]KLL12052.1 hypothetical protein FrCorBMG51_07260 [Protofrankia coriariae]ONH35341.1 hypothetical protein BL254_11740 [Protofrankia sp. BMG5.30]
MSQSKPPVMRHSLDALTATLARALADARHPQVEAARRSQVRRSAGRSPAPPGDPGARSCDRLVARTRTYNILGVASRLRAITT